MTLPPARYAGAPFLKDHFLRDRDDTSARPALNQNWQPDRTSPSMVNVTTDAPFRKYVTVTLPR